MLQNVTEFQKEKNALTIYTQFCEWPESFGGHFIDD